MNLLKETLSLSEFSFDLKILKLYRKKFRFTTKELVYNNYQISAFSKKEIKDMAFSKII